MTITPLPGTGHPRMFGWHDYRRSYVLPEVEANIPVRDDAPGDCGAWHHARAVLAEVARALPAAPVRLHFRELETPTRVPFGIEVTAVVRTVGDVVITVVSRSESAPAGPRGDYWELTVNGLVPEEGTGTFPPSPPWLGRLVRREAWKQGALRATPPVRPALPWTREDDSP
ncbi:hypothetical protein LZ318_30805 [Saccharopolyspora indica]|uniref:hypothetical protein n=1 Tax=Saccharopolyspora indica TaxID=1229659 RepID=UPI0022EAD87C|nr:hypothetical protein [Saccharopolyspora indica]MDA3644377.1 hypothetical protein [Saccharopolyspora indica]